MRDWSQDGDVENNETSWEAPPEPLEVQLQYTSK